MHFPVYLHLGPFRIHPHLFFETLAYLVAFRVYLLARRKQGDSIDDLSRWWIIAAAAVGAAVGSRVLYWFEDPRLTLQRATDPAFLMGGKTIVGALAGGLLFVELAKHKMKIRTRTGGLFALPLCVGIAIGRIGCFLTGLEDHTTGTPSSLPWAVNFGDGIPRHPTQAYEAIFVLILAVVLWRRMQTHYLSGDMFKGFMVAYFSFRLLCDFLKPDVRVLFGLSSIQLMCLFILAYYSRDVLRWTGFSPARQRHGELAQT